MKNISTIGFIFFFTFFVDILNAQNEWPRIYLEDTDAPKLNMVLSYDNGYILTGRIKPNNPKYNWIIKTDINGEVLWEKTLGNGNNSIVTRGIGINELGEVYLSGMTSVSDLYGDPFVMKLNACGEKEWCKIYSAPGQQNHAPSLVITRDGGCVVLFDRMGENLWTDRNCLVRFDQNGNLLWKQCYNSSDSLLANQLCRRLVSAPDKGFLLTGYCIYADTSTGLGWQHPYYIKTDSLGNFEWETVPDKHGMNGDGQGRATVISPDSNYYYSSISHYYRNNTAAPALLKMDMSGNVVGIYDIAQPDFFGIMSNAKFISDTTLIASAAWGPQWAGWPEAIIIDTVGNILDSQSMLENDYLANTGLAIDNKYLFYTMDIDENEEFDAYLFKLNQNLETDTLYTQPFFYDSLCDGEIVSDTIDLLDCGLIVGDREIYVPKEMHESELKIYPNPARGKFTVSCLLSAVGSQKMQVFDLYGRKVEEIEIRKGENEVEIRTTGWPKGLYLVRLVSEGSLLGNGKVVVE